MNNKVIDAPSHLKRVGEADQQSAYSAPNYKDLDSASHALDKAIGKFFNAAWGNTMPNEGCTAINSSTGLGKSTQMRRHAAHFITDLRARGSDTSVVVFVSTIDLALEQAQAFRQEFPSLSAECFIGLTSDNPDKKHMKMCERSDEAKALVGKGIPISNLCGSKQSNEWCKHHINSGCANPCGYSRQHHTHADIWFMAHQKLFTPKPSNITPAAVVIDEMFWGASISKPEDLKLSALTDVTISSDYRAACEAVIPYLIQAPAGYLDVDRLRHHSNQALAACYTASDELKKHCSYNISPSMTSHAVKTTLDGAPSKSIIRFWQALAAALQCKTAGKTPYLKKLTTKTNDHLIQITQKQSIHRDWNAETLILDATLSPAITKLYFPEMTTQVVECPMSATTVTQIYDRPLSKKMMLPDPSRGEQKNAELIANLAKLISILTVRLASIHKGVRIGGHSDPIKMLLVTNKAIEDALKKHGSLPRGIATMHYGATSGIDAYKDVPSLVIAGRLMLPILETERLASLLSGEVIAEASSQSWYPTRCQTIVTEPSEEIVESNYHTDPIAEEVRYSKTEGELIQAIGRARAIRRNALKPLDILILTNVPIPHKVDLLTTWNEVVPTKVEALLADKKIAPLSNNELARVYPISFNSNKVARTAIGNFLKRYPTIQDVVKANLSALLPIYSITREKGTQIQHYKELRLVKYTRTTKGAKPCFAVVFDIEPDGIEEALSLLVGELKSYQYICAFSTEAIDLPGVT